MSNTVSHKSKVDESGETEHTNASDTIKYDISAVTLDPDTHSNIFLDGSSK